MKSLIFLALLSMGLMASAQDSIVSIDVLSAPQSPAANLMGFTDSEILKPESPTDFMTNIKTASDGFSAVPNSLAMDFRFKNFYKPAQNNSFKEYTRIVDTAGKMDIGNNVRQTAIFSLGYQNYTAQNDSLQTGQAIGIGFKFSLFRGKKLDADFDTAYTQLKNLQEEIGALGQQAQLKQEETPEYKRLDSLRLDAAIAGDNALAKRYTDTIEKYQTKWVVQRNEMLSQEKEGKADFTDLKKIAEKLEFKSYGLFWDFAGGAVLNFPTANFDYSIWGSSGFWTTFGYEGKNGLSYLALGRTLYNPGFVHTNTAGILDTANVANYDFGGRILYEHPGKSFSLSAEGVYRGAFGNAYDPMYRFTFNVGYEIRKNMKLTFMFGRDYDGAISREGNVISAIQLLAGFGSKKNLKR